MKRAPTVRRLTALALVGVLYVQPLTAVLWTAPPRVRVIAPTSDGPIARTPVAQGLQPPRGLSVLAPPSAVQIAPPVDPAAPVTVFPATRYTRTTGAPNVFTASFAVPPWLVGPFTLRIDNGAPDGRNRLSSATVWINNVEVAGPSSFGQNVGVVTRSISVAAQSTLRLRLASNPGGYLTVSVTGTNGDHRAPRLTVAEPASAFVNAMSPRIVVRYGDAVAPDEPAASGIGLASLQITVDGIDRTADFASTGTEASATLDLAEGRHLVDANVSDVAGNVATHTLPFTVDRTPPTVGVATPALNAYVPSAMPQIRVEYADDHALDLDSLKVFVNGVERTALFAKAAGWATATIPADSGLADGLAGVTVRLRDAAGNESSTASLFTVDTIAPHVVIVEPGNAQYTAVAAIDVRGGVIDASPVTVRVDSVDAGVQGSEFMATGVPVGAPPEVTLRAVATDAAGHTGEATVTLRVDRDPPTVSFTSPVPGTYLKGPIVDVAGSVSDASPVMVIVNGEPAAVAGGAFTGAVAAQDGPLTVHAIAVDAAGNASSADLSLTVDTVAPSVTITEPAQGFVTAQGTATLSGLASDSAPFTVRVGGAEVPVTGGAFTTEVALPGEGSNTLFVTALDGAGNETTVDVSVIVDRTPPELTIATPEPGAIVANLPLAVQGSVIDLTPVTIAADGVPAEVTGSAWQASFAARPDGEHQVTVIATDAAGNPTTRTRAFVLDTTPPVVTIVSPAPATLTRLDTIVVTGTVDDLTLDTVSVNGVPAGVSPTAGVSGFSRTFTATVSIAEGDNHVIVTASDRTGRSGLAEVDLTRDSTPPVVELLAPDRVTRRLPGEVSVSVSDNLDGVQVTVTVDGLPLGTGSQASFQTPLVIPADARPGDQLVVRAVATDRAGNTADASRVVRLAADGAIVGQVLSDDTGRLRPDATVTYIGALSSPAPVQTDERGRYTFSTGDSSARLLVSAPGMTPVEREVAIASETGTVVLDARLTPLAALVTVGPDGTSMPVVDSSTQYVVSGFSRTNMTLVVPAGAASQPTEIRATPLSGQGLPALLPLGWSPVRAIDVRASQPLQATLELRATALPAADLFLAQYTASGWRLASGPLAVAPDGTLDVALAPIAPFAPTGDGAIAPTVFALIAPDAGLIAPAVGEPLPALDVAPIPLTATSTGIVDPPTVSPSGGTAFGTLTVHSPAPLPSGTVVQAAVTETFNLTNGDVASEEQRTQDLILYRTAPFAPTSDSGLAPTSDGLIALTAEFPIAPSRSFTVSELASGTVHLDILAGREIVRGQTGGSEPVALASAGATLHIARGALTDDTAIAFQSAVLSSFLPASTELTPVAELVLDFSGRILGIGADLGVPLATVGPYDPATDTLLVARIDRVEGIPHPVVVALAAVSGDRVVSQPYAGLDGLTRGGRYVVYRVSTPIGFLAGQATAAGSPARAIVSTATLPFIGPAGLDGRFIVATRTGPVPARARVPGTSLGGDASAEVAARATTPLDFALQGAVTIAVVTPADGAVAVSPGVQVEIATAAGINPLTIVPGNVRLVDLGPVDEAEGGVPVAARTVLSGSGRTLAIVPAARLVAGHRFRIEAAGLADLFGGAILVPAATFVTKADEGPVYDVKLLVVSFPDDNGQVTLTGPAGTLPPGSDVLIINHGSGEVSTFPVFNDGSVHGEFFAALTDRLQITITDTLGNVTTFARNTYVDTDGTTSVNEGGGIIEGPSGVEVRVPEGALNPFDVALMKLSAIPLFLLAEAQKAGLPGLQIAGGVQLESPSLNFFLDEVDLAFPKPADAPDGAIYFILRKLTGPEGRIAYESLDFGVVEGEGAGAKVVTASPPFSGYQSDLNGYTAAGLDGGAVAGQFQNQAILAWAVDQASPGSPFGGVITGRVLRTVWQPGSPVPTYEPVKGALVSGVDPTGQPVFATPAGAQAPTVAVSQADGTYALFDTRYTGGPVTVSATLGGQTIIGFAYEANPEDTKSPGLRFARHIATTNLTYPAVQPPQPPATVGITLTRTVEGVEQVIRDGVVVAGTEVGARFLIETDAELRDVSINGAPAAIVPDAGQSGQWVLNIPYLPAQPGLYTIVANAQPAIGDVVPTTLTFRAIAVGGGVSDLLPDDAPVVVEGRTVPKRNATGAAVTVFPQVTFSEPVKNVPAGVSLQDESGAAVPFALLGVGPDGPVTDVQAATPITSLTIQPLLGLRYGTRYTLSLSASLIDLDDGTNDTPANKPLVPYETSFTTFAPTGLGATDEDFTAGGLAIVGDRAYVAQNMGPRTRLRLFDVSDPVAPVEITGSDTGSFALHPPPPVALVGNPADLVVEDDSPVTGGRLLAIATNPFSSPFIPANVRLFDVSDDQTWHWIGAVTLGKEPQDGLIKRLVLRGTRLYALVAGQGKGVQVIDLPTARDLFAAQTDGEEGLGFWNVQESISVQGRGFGEISIVQSVFLDTGTGLNSLMHDLAVLDMTIDGIAQPIAVVTGRNPIAVVNPQTGQVLYNGPIRNADGSPVTSWGFAIEAGTVNGRPIALVSAVSPGGATANSHLFVVVDLTDPSAPRALGTMTLPGIAQSVSDIVLKGTTAYVGTESGTYVISLAELTQPRLISTIGSVGGRLAFMHEQILFGTAKSNATLQHALGGVRSAALGGPIVIVPRPVPALTRAVPAPANAQAEDELVSGIAVRARVIGAEPTVGVVTMYQNGLSFASQAVNWVNGQAQLLLSRGTRILRDARLSVTVSAATADGDVQSEPTPIDSGKVRLLIDANNDTHLTTEDVEAMAQQKPWAFWEATPNTVGTPEGVVDYATIRLQSEVPIERLRLRLAGTGVETTWVLTEKASPRGVAGSPATGKEYLSRVETATLQTLYARAACTNVTGGPIGTCVSEGGVPIELRRFPARERNFLVSCRKCPEASQLREFVLDYIDTETGRAEELTRAKVDIRPLKNWMTVYTARSDDGSLRPRPTAILEQDWPTDVDPKAQTLTVLVHGFNVDREDALGFFSTYAKRLYWGGHPVLLRQRGSAQVVGLSWPGDHGTGIPFSQGLFFPEDEFHALQTGKVLADLIMTRLSPAGSLGERSIDIVAHSLGNLVVNSALTFLPPGKIQTYVMNEAAVPAEAFNSRYVPDDAFVEEAREHGFPDDAVWETEWQEIVAERSQPGLPARCNNPEYAQPEGCWSWYDFWRAKIGADKTDEELKTAYTVRWRQLRPSAWDPNVLESGTAPVLGPWRGIFEGNFAKARVVNAFNAGDFVLSQMWPASQNTQKPNIGPLGLLKDSKTIQYWGRLDSIDSDEGGGLVPLGVHAKVTRQWAELALWFQSLSVAAGTTSAFQFTESNPAPGPVTHLNFSAEAPGGFFALFDSHTYLGSEPLYSVFGLFERLRDALAR